MAVSNGRLFPRVDTVADQLTKANTGADRHFIQVIRWDGAAVNDICQINDGNGSIIYGPVTATGNNFIDIQPIYRVLNQPVVATLGGGFVTFYIR